MFYHKILKLHPFSPYNNDCYQFMPLLSKNIFLVDGSS